MNSIVPCLVAHLARDLRLAMRWSPEESILKPLKKLNGFVLTVPNNELRPHKYTRAVILVLGSHSY
jgi:hypothetical protein